MKTLVLLLGVMALMVGCTTYDNGAGGTGASYDTSMDNNAEGLVNPASRQSTGALDIGTGAAGMGVGTGIGSGSTGSGRP